MILMGSKAKLNYISSMEDIWPHTENKKGTSAINIIKEKRINF